MAPDVSVDLAKNRPGEAARRKANELKEVAPFKTLVARLLHVNTEERAYRVGADGEVVVARRLANLGPHWRVLHAIQVGGAPTDIDHLVIGPPGVFTLNTKNHAGKHVWVAGRTFLVNGQKVAYLPTSRHEAARTGKLLSRACRTEVPVTPVLVIICKGLDIKAQPTDVRVDRPSLAVKWLLGLDPVLDVDRIEAIYAKARISTTWEPGRNTGPEDGLELGTATP